MSAGDGAGLRFQLEGFTNNQYQATGAIQSIWDKNQTDDELSRDASLLFRVAQNGNLNERMIIKHNGRVGIGTTSPDATLHVKSTKTANASSEDVIFKVESKPGGGGASDRLFEISQKNDGTISNTYSILRMGDGFTNTGTPNEVVIRSSGDSYFNGGDVGIGTTTPSEKLQVNGCIKHSGGTIGTSCASDKTLKDNIEDIEFDENLIEKFLSLRPRTYVYKTDYENLYYGFIAQEVEKVDPSLLGGKNKDGKMTVNYEKIKWLHFKASQENSRQIASLKEDISELKKAEDKNSKLIDQLKSENSALKSYLCQKDKNAPFCEK